MTTSEDILLQVNHVRHKKSDGVLFLMSERIAWLMSSKDTFSVSYQYTDIKMQKISPDGKPKIQLQVVLQDGGASTFHFNSPDGEQKQRRDRDSVKQLLHRLLPMFQSRVNKELEEKERLLRENPTLLQLYQDLVITRITTPDQFWQQHAAEFVNKATVKQEVGVSAGFLTDIRPQTDGSSGLKYNLNADIISSIFKTYPAVRRKHIENVPARMSESEFWTRFFQSHYFHRDRTNLSNKDIFTECAKLDEKDIQNELARDIENPLLDVANMNDCTLDEGFGVGDGRLAGSSAASCVSSLSSTSASMHGMTPSVSCSMIKRFNQHSMSVLKASVEKAASSGADSSCGDESQHSATAAATQHQLKVADTAKQCIEAKVCYADLETPDSFVGQPLKLVRPERYLNGPTPQQTSSGDNVSQQQHGAESTSPALHHNQLKQNLLSWKPITSQPVDSQTAVSILGELSPGGALMKSTNKELAASVDLPDQVKTEMAGLYRSISELLRHFWSCFPVNSSELEAKLATMHETLQKFQQCKVQKFEDDLYRQYGLGPEVTTHLNHMLDTAAAKFQQWRTVKRRH